MNPSEIPDNFSQFRRRLLWASTLLAILGGANIRFERVPLVNQALPDARIWVLYAALWLFWLYAAVGLAVYFQVERRAAFGALMADVKREGVRRYLHRLGQRHGWLAQRTEPRDEVSVWPMDIEVEIYKHFESEHRMRGGGQPAQKVVEQGFVRINRPVWALLVLRSIVFRLAFGPTFFQYALPLLWACVAMLIANTSGWTGSIPAVWEAAAGEDTALAARKQIEVLQSTMCEWHIPERKR